MSKTPAKAPVLRSFRCIGPIGQDVEALDAESAAHIFQLIHGSGPVQVVGDGKGPVWTAGVCEHGGVHLRSSTRNVALVELGKVGCEGEGCRYASPDLHRKNRVLAVLALTRQMAELCGTAPEGGDATEVDGWHVHHLVQPTRPANLASFEACQAPLVIAGHGTCGAAAEMLAAQLLANGAGEGLEAVITFGAAPSASRLAAGWLRHRLSGRGVAYWNGLERLPPIPRGWRRALGMVRLAGPYTGGGWWQIATHADWRRVWRRHGMMSYRRALVAARRWAGRPEVAHRLGEVRP